jgi:hypothetical protein
VSGPIAVRRPHATAWANASLALAGCLWGTGFLFGKIAFREMTVAENVFFRFLFACLILVPILIGKGKTFAIRDLSWLVAAAVVGVPVQFVMQFKGLQLTTVSHASLDRGDPTSIDRSIVDPVFARATEQIGMAGVAIVSRRRSRHRVFCRSFQRGCRTNGCGRSPPTAVDVRSRGVHSDLEAFDGKLRFSSNHDLDAQHRGSVAVCRNCIVPVRFHFSIITWGAAAGQGLLATAGAYLARNWGLQRVAASRAGVFLNLEPLVGSLLGVSLLHERLGPLAILGGVLILGPAVYFSRKPK